MKAIDDQFDVVGLVAVEFHSAADLHDLSIHADTHITLTGHLFKKLSVVSLPCPDQRSEQLDLVVRLALHQQLHDLLIAVLDHGFSSLVAVGRSCTGKKQAEEVVDLCDRAYRGSRAPARGLLLDADHRAETIDLIHLWPFHIADELPGISGKRFHISALPFRKDGVKGQ